MSQQQSEKNNSWKRLEEAKNENISQQICQNYLCPANVWVTQILQRKREMLPSGGESYANIAFEVFISIKTHGMFDICRIPDIWIHVKKFKYCKYSHSPSFLFWGCSGGRLSGFGADCGALVWPTRMIWHYYWLEATLYNYVWLM